MPQEPSMIAQMGQNSFAPDMAGPFSGLIQAGLTPSQQQPETRYAGGGGKLGTLAFVGDKFLEGFQKGRLIHYAAQEAQKTRQFRAGLALTQNAIDNAPTPELQQQARQIQSNWVIASMQDSVGGEDGKGKGKKQPKKDQQGQPSSGSGLHDVVKSGVSKFFSTLGGPNLPESSVGNIKDLQASLAPILGASTITSRFADQVGNVSSAVQTYLHDHPDATAEQLYALPVVAQAGQKLITMGQTPDQVNAWIKQGIGVAKSEMQKVQEASAKVGLKSQELGLKSQELAFGLQEDAVRAEREFYRDLNDPPESREGAATPASKLSDAKSAPKSKLAEPVPEAQKTTQQKAADQYQPSSFRQFIGQPRPAFPKEVAKPAWAVAPDGRAYAIQTITTPNLGITYNADAAHRFFDVKAAEKAGWTIESARPIVSPRPEYKMAESPDGKKETIYYEINRATGKWSPVMDPSNPKKYLIAKMDSRSDAEVGRMKAAIRSTIKTRDATAARIRDHYGTLMAKPESYFSAAGIVPDEKKIQEYRGRLNAQMQQELASNDEAARAEVQLYTRDAPMLNPFGQEQAPPPEPTLQFDPGTPGSTISEWLNQ